MEDLYLINNFETTVFKLRGLTNSCALTKWIAGIAWSTCANWIVIADMANGINAARVWTWISAF